MAWNVVSDKTGLVSASIHHGRYDGEKSSASLTTFQNIFTYIFFKKSIFEHFNILTPKQYKALQS